MTDDSTKRGTPSTRHLLSLPHLSQFAVEHLLLLPLGAAIALIWVNTGPESYYRFKYAFQFAVNDVAMVFFFGLIGKEVAEATAPGGVLHPWRRAWLPVTAAAGATLMPAWMYGYLVDWLDEPMLVHGWPVTLAVDLAFCYFVARFIFRQHPIIPFLLLLGMTSDAVGFVAIALAGPSHGRDLAAAAVLVALAVVLAAVLRRLRVKSFWPYVLAAGGLSWFGMYRGGLHPALALVPVMPFLPHAARDPGFFVDASPKARDTLSRFEIWWRYPVHVTLFFFGLVNAGVPIGAIEPGVWGLPLAVIAGRPLGVLLGTGIALVAGLHLSHRVTWRELTVVGLIAAMGFSVGLFFCVSVLPPGQLRSETSMGVFLSLAAAPLAMALARQLRVGRWSSDESR